ncbi:MAG: hypothetical protein US58_C0034G0005 [Candidatus Magasanikbacteria bacterium GW2011_GWA2_37_8]|uniref:Uncharacterized protein n=1 Tax=Candidatus Magasanikbacteria bacterium GW2011_GWA2_37_8 TaxID=1619036 RepID=A0A0G0JR35_9BACT|nr:MAG: hypothetical protein US58_C0034G0005 [Candidatus Magasanikbacteria bacterium GW2011_GWA2_37_8]
MPKGRLIPAQFSVEVRDDRAYISIESGGESVTFRVPMEDEPRLLLFYMRLKQATSMGITPTEMDKHP